MPRGSPRPARPARRGAGRLQNGSVQGADPPDRARRGGSLSSQAGRHQDAIDYWQRAIAVNPWRSGYFTELARVELQLRDWRAAAEACRQALRLNPSSLQVRKWLVQCYLHLGNVEAARREFEILLGFDPPDRDELLRRFSSLVTPR